MSAGGPFVTGVQGVAVGSVLLPQEQAIAFDSTLFTVTDSPSTVCQRTAGATPGGIVTGVTDITLNSAAPRVQTGAVSVASAPSASVVQFLGDALSFQAGQMITTDALGSSWRISRRYTNVAPSGTCVMPLGFVYVDVGFSKCPRLVADLRITLSDRNANPYISLDAFVISAGYVNYSGSTYVGNYRSKASLASADGIVAVSDVTINGGSAMSAGHWYPVVATLTQGSQATADVMVVADVSSAW